MPLNVNLPGVGVIAVPDNLSPDEQAAFLRRAAASKGLFLEPPAATFGQKAGATGAGLISGVGNVVGFPGQVAGIAGIAPMDNVVTRAGENIREFGRGLTPDIIKEQEQARARAVQEAAKEGLLSEFGTAIGETYKRGLLFPTFAESAASLVGTGFGGLATRGAVGLAARGAGKELSQKALERAALTGAIGTGATMQGADVGADTYAAVMKDPKLPETREYQELAAQGLDDAAIRQQLALNAARIAGAGAAAISVGTQFLPGGASIEKILAGQKLGRGLIGGALKGAAGEAVQESLEEGGGQFVSNIARPGEQPMLAGVGEAAGLGAIGGLGLGGGAGALAGAVEGAQDRAVRAQEEQAAAIEAARAEQQAKIDAMPSVSLLENPAGATLGAEELNASIISARAALPSVVKPFNLDEASAITGAPSIGDNIEVLNRLIESGDIVQQPDGLLRPVSEAERIVPKFEGANSVFAVPTTQEGEEVADKYRVTIPGMRFKRDVDSQEEAQKIAKEIGSRFQREAESKFDGKIKERKDAIKDINDALEEAKVRPSISDTKIAKLTEAANQNIERLTQEIEGLEASKAAAIKEPTVEPINARPSIKDGYEVRTVLPDGQTKVLNPFVTRDEAEDLIIKSATPEQIEAIRQDTDPNRASIRERLNKIVTPEVTTEPPAEGAAPTESETIAPTPELEQKIQAVTSRLRPVLDQMGLKDISLNIQNRLQEVIKGKVTPINGYYFNKVIAAALEGDREGRGVEATVGHEAIHALRQLGMFSDKEWQILTKKAKADWIQKYDIRSRYGNVQIDEERVIEEAVADAYGDWFAGRLKETGVIQGLFNRIKNFLQRVGSVFRGQGFTTSSDVFQRAFKGELAGERVERPSATKVYETPTRGAKTINVDGVERPTTNSEGRPIHPTEEGTRNFWKWFGDSKLVDEQGQPLVMYHGTEQPDVETFKASSFGKLGGGIYASPSKDFANRYGKRGNVMPVYIKSENPFVVSRDVGNPLDEIARSFNEFAGKPSASIAPDVPRVLSSNGLSGVVRLNPNGNIRELTVFAPEQVKSAVGNVGAFSALDSRVLYSMAFKPPKEGNFKNWFRNSKIVNEDGTPQVWYHGTARDIEEFRPKQANAIFLTTNPDFAESFADASIDWMITNATQVLPPDVLREAVLRGLNNAKNDLVLDAKGVEFYKNKPLKDVVKYSPAADWVRDSLKEVMPSGENILPLVVRAEKPFDYDNPEHLDDLIAWAKSLDKRNLAREFVEDNKYNISIGEWSAIESPAVQGFLKEKGYDGFYVSEGGNKNLAVYDPNQVKSPFNSGLWGPTGNISYSLPFTRSEEPRILKNGEIVGSPPNARTVAAREGLVSSMADLLMHPYAMLNESYDWYEKSGAAIRRFARGDKALTERMVRLFALYSQANGVGGNTTAVIKSIAQLARGEPTAFAGRFPNTTAANIPTLLSAPTMDVSLPGVDDKLMNFYRNLHDGTYQTDTFEGASTIDRWMMRLFGYPHAEDQEQGGASSVSATQYAYGKDLIKRIAAEHKKRTGQNLKAHQVQAVLWTYVKNDTDYNALSPEKQKDFKPEIVNFADYIRRATANVTWESRPSTKVDLIPGIHDAPRNQKEEFNRDVRALFVDENGVDILAQLLNAIPLYTSDTSIGAYENRITPNVVTELVLGKDDGTYLTDVANKYAAALGYILKQDAVPWYRADPTASGKLASKGYRLSLQEGTITPEMEDALFNHLNNVMPGVGFTRVDNGLDFINFRGEDGKPFFMKDKDYESALKSALASFDHDVNFTVTPFKTESQYIFNDWESQPNGEGYLERFSESELANLQGFLADRSAAYLALAEDYGQRYGWSKPASEGDRLQRQSVEDAKATLDQAAPPPQPDKLLSVPFKSAKDGAKAIDSLVGKVPVVSGLVNKILDIGANNSALIYKTLTLGQLAEVVGARLPQVKKYHDTLKDMFGYRDTLINGAAKIAEDWQTLTAKNPTVANNMSNVMHDATIAGFDPSPDRRKAPASSPSEKDIQRRFDALPEEYKALYKKVRNYYSWRMSEYMKLLEGRIEEAVQDKTKARELMLRLKDRYETGKVPQPYFPLARFGDYWVSFERNGEPEYHMFENVRERDAFEMQVKLEGATKVMSGYRMNGVLDAGKSAFGFIKDVMDNLDTSKTGPELKDDIWQMYLQHLPEVSMRKHFIHRKNIAGFNNDALRAFQTNAFHGAYYMGRLKYSGIAADQLNGIYSAAQEMSRQGDDFATKAGQVWAELSERQPSIMNPSDSNVATQLAGSAGFAYYLATPAAAMVNLTQNFIVGIPAMGSKFGYGRASAELSLAMKQFISSAQFDVEGMTTPEVEKGLRNSFDIIRTLEQLKKEAKGNPALEKKYDLEIAAINQMYLNGTITRSQAMDLAGATDSATLAGGKIATLNRFLGMAFHGAEVFNRTTTAIASYRLAMKQLEKSAPQLSQEERHKRAVQTAADMVEKAHFNYSDANTAPFLKSLGSLGKVIFMFKKYSQAMTYLLVNETRLYGQYLVNKYKGTPMEQEAVQRAKEARDMMLGVLGMTGVFAGTIGLPYPLMAVTMALFNMTFGDDDDEMFDAETQFKNTLADMFGADAAMLIANGPVSYLTGADFASRVGLNSLWFRDINQPKDEIDAVTQYYIQIGGPALGMVMNVATGMQRINEGQLFRGIETMLPNVLKDQFQAYRYATEGVLTLKGDPVLDEVSTYETFLTAIGFTPSEVARQYKENSEIKGAETRINTRRKRILGKFAIALNNDDFEMMDEIYDDIADFNGEFPDFAITGETLNKSIKARRQAAAEMEHGIRVNKRLKDTLGEGRYLED